MSFNQIKVRMPIGDASVKDNVIVNTVGLTIAGVIFLFVELCKKATRPITDSDDFE